MSASAIPRLSPSCPSSRRARRELLYGVARGGLCSLRPRFSAKTACGVVIAAPGYPGSYPKGIPVDLGGVEPEALLFHASTSRGDDGIVRTGGGRCFTAVGIGADWETARNEAYSLAARARFEGAWFRPDIGAKIFRAIRRKRESVSRFTAKRQGQGS